MPFDLKTVQSALKDFATFSKSLVDLFQKLPKGLLDFAEKVTK